MNKIIAILALIGSSLLVVLSAIGKYAKATVKAEEGARVKEALDSAKEREKLEYEVERTDINDVIDELRDNDWLRDD